MKKIIYVVLIVIVIIIAVSIKRPITGNKVADQALEVFSNIVENNKERKTFHMELQHFGFKLGDGYKIEWTKNTKVNNLDLLVVLNADEFTDVGVKVDDLKTDFIYKEDPKNNERMLIHALDISDKNKVSYGAIDGMRRLLSQNPSIVSYNSEEDYYMMDLNKDFAIWISNKNKEFNIALVVNSEELVDKGLLVNKLPSNWQVLDDNHIIRYFKIGEV